MTPCQRARRAVLVAWLVTAPLLAAASGTGAGSIDSRDLRAWLTYIASDELQGRAVFSAGAGLAAAFIERHLREWGVKPAGDGQTYLQMVEVRGVRRTSRSRVIVHVGDRVRTFADGDGVRFPRNVGAPQRLEIDRVQFAGYGLDAPALGQEAYGSTDVRGAAVVWLGAAGPAGLDGRFTRLLNGRSRYATDVKHAAASIGAGPVPGGGGRRDGGVPSGDRPRNGGAVPPVDFTTADPLDRLLPPGVTGRDELFEFLFSRAPVRYGELKRLANARKPLPSFPLDAVRIVFDVKAEYEVVRTRFTPNIVGLVEGSDPALKDTFVAFGAHYDHVGYAEGELVAGTEGSRPGSPGRVTPGAEHDRIWNGADDDGSGTVTLMSLARAFAAGPRPKRSLLFVWHAGEEPGQWGSRYFVAHPTVPLDRIVAQLNIDMVGRNRDNRTGEADTVYVVGADRISTELDLLARTANERLASPLVLDDEFNDPADPEQLYYRSDHYSYAARGIPVVFFTTGLHPDYHANTDDVSRIEFDKLTRVAQLVYETGASLANLDRPLNRDHLGPRTGTTTPAPAAR
jgi:hypothetical protein